MSDITILPGTIKISKEDYVFYLAAIYRNSGCSKDESIEKAECRFDSIVSKKSKRYLSE
jgi:hypothetical protein